MFSNQENTSFSKTQQPCVKKQGAISMKNVKKRFCMLNALLIIISVLSGGNAFAKIYLSEDWETGTSPSIWPYKQAPEVCDAAWQGNIFNSWKPELAEYCVGNASWTLAGLSTTHARGTRSLFINREAGQPTSPDINKPIPAPYPNKIYMRFYLWMDGNYIDFNTPTSRFPIHHFLFTNSAQSQTGFRINIMSSVPYDRGQCNYTNVGGRPYAFFLPQDDDWDWRNGTYTTCYNLLDHLNEWQEVQFLMDATTDTFTIWMNGNQVYTATERITQTDFTLIQFSNYMSDEDGSPFSTSYYVDDIVISDSYISSGGQTTLSPPSKLIIQ